MSGVIAIVGRPNVGKSALFNRIIGKRIAIVHDMPGVTRDRISAQGEWRGKPFTLLDTGGIGLLRGEKSKDLITGIAIDQVEAAIESADQILMVVNAQDGVTPLDREVATRLREHAKSVTVIVNKVDIPAHEERVIEFSELGFEDLFPTSAIHGRGTESVLKKIVPRLPPPAKRDAEQTPDPDAADSEEIDGFSGPLKLAIVGRPNVGKSSIINSLTQSDRVIVSDIPGTTRDAVDVPFEVTTEGEKEQYVLIDTAGIRKRNRIDDTVEFFSTIRSENAIERCDLAVLVLDAETGITEQDKKIAGHITESGCGCIVVVNKWDLVADKLAEARREINRKKKVQAHAAKGTEEPMTTLAEFAEWVQSQMFFLSHAPVIFSSAKTGFQLDRLLEAVRFVKDQLAQRIPTAILNRAVRDIMEKRPPESATGAPIKFYYGAQVSRRPPTFLLFLNRDKKLSDNYMRYLENEMRKAFGFEGCPIRIVAKPRPKTIPPGGARSAKKGPSRKKAAKKRGEKKKLS